MPENEREILALQEELSDLKYQVAATKALQKKKDRLERDYAISQIRFKTIFDQSSLGNKFIDANLKIIKVNKALVKLLGYSKKELIGNLITNFVHPNFAERWKALQHELWANEKPSFSIDTCIIRKDKNIIWCHVTSILVEDNGKTLGYTILEDISGRKKLENDLKEANEQILIFEQRVLEITIDTQQQERSRIAEDLHNSLGQLLFAAKLSLDRVTFEKSEQKKDNTSGVKNAKDILSECIRESKRISHGLLPTILEDFGLKEAIQDICRQFSGTIDFKTRFTGLFQRLPKYLEIAIYRMVQELTMNVVKHADASKGSVDLTIGRKEILLRVEDNGRGFDVAKDADSGIGIRSIKNKLHLLKGVLDITSKTNKGTVVDIVLPKKQ